MLAGRNSLAISAWADQGEAWLREQFRGKALEFHTAWDTEAETITLRVYRKTKRIAGGFGTWWNELLFEVTEPADIFISHATLTKIILVS